MSETVPDIINLTGSGMADILAGDSRHNVIEGMGGDDRIYGGPGGGNDDLHGGDGNDHVFGGRGDDILHGDGGNDNLWGNGGENTYYGGAGSDMIHANPGDLTINGWVKDEDPDTEGDQSVMEMMKDPRSIDTVSFAHLKEEALEVDDNEGVAVSLAADGGGYGRYSGDDNPSLSGMILNIENIIGSMGDDHLTGSDGKNTIEGGDGGDTLIGGGGEDTVSYRSSDGGVRVELGDSDTAEADTSRGDAGSDTVTGFENVIGSNFNDVLGARMDARESDNPGSKLWGLDGDDSLEGGPGDDTLEGGLGADELNGGDEVREDTEMYAQRNTLSYAESSAAVMINLHTLSFSGGDAEGDEIETYDYTTGTGDNERDFEVATFVNVTGSAHNDQLTGDMFNNDLNGGDGDDTLRGREGSDKLTGGKGADVLDGGEDAREANDMVPDGSGAMMPASEDWAVYRGASSAVTINLNTGSGTAGEAMGDTLRNIEIVWGSSKHGDTFIAGEGADVIHGDGGSDTVSYEASKRGVTVTLTNGDYTDEDGFFALMDAQVMTWGDGDRAVAIGDKPDGKASYADGDVLDSIENLTGSSYGDMLTGQDEVPNVLKGGAGKDVLNGGSGDDKLHGGAGDDTLGAREDDDSTEEDETAAEAGDDHLYGDAGNDTLRGGAGNDRLYGGAGDDDMHGGDGIDTFVFAPGNGSDVILADGFNATSNTGKDRIDLRAFEIDPNDLGDLISDRTGNAVINLEGYGGGRITITDVTKAQLGTEEVGDQGTPENLADDTGIFIL